MKTDEKKKEVITKVKAAVVDTAKTVAIGVAEVALEVAEDGIKKLKKKLPTKK